MASNVVEILVKAKDNTKQAFAEAKANSEDLKKSMAGIGQGAGIIALGSSLTAMAAPLGGLTLAVGAFGALAAPTFSKVEKAVTSTGAAGKKAWAQLDPTQTGIAKAIEGIKTSFEQASKAIEPAILYLVKFGGVILQSLMPSLQILAKAGASSISAFLAPLLGLVASPFFKQFADMMAKLAVQASQILGPALVGLLKVLMQIFMDVGPTGIKLLAQLAPAFVQMVAALTPILVIGAKVSLVIVDMLSKFHLLPLALGLATGALLVFKLGMAETFATMLANPFVAVAAALVVLALLIIKYHNQIWDTVKKIWGDVYNFIKTTWDNILSFAKQWWPLLLGPSGVIMKYHNDIYSSIKKIWNDILGFFKSIWNSIKSDVSSDVSSMKNTLSSAWNAISNTVKSTWNAVLSFFKSVWNNIKSTVSSDVNSVKSTLSSAWNAITNAVKSAWNSILSFIKSVWNNIKSAITSAANSVKSFLSSAWNQMFSTVKSVWGNIVSFFKGMPSKLVGALTGLGHSLGSFASAALNEMWNAFKRVGGDIESWFSNFGKTIVNVVKKIWGVLSPSSVFAEIGDNLMLGLEKGIKRSANKAHDANKAAQVKLAASKAASGSGSKYTGSFGAGVTQWAPDILKALAMLGQSSSNLGAVEHRMMQESGGNPNAINLTDINAQHGDPSRGLMQTIMTTFEAYRSDSLPNSIYNPMANIFAGLNYAVNSPGYRGRSLASVMLQPGGYAAGGTGTGLAMVGEHGRELIRLPGGSTVHSNPDTERMMSTGAGTNVTVSFDSSGQSAFEQFMLTTIRKFARVQGGGNVQQAFGRN